MFFCVNSPSFIISPRRMRMRCPARAERRKQRYPERFCGNFKTFFPEGVTMSSSGEKRSCSLTRTLSEAVRFALHLTGFAFLLYVGDLRASTRSPSRRSAKRMGPSLLHAQLPSVQMRVMLTFRIVKFELHTKVWSAFRRNCAAPADRLNRGTSRRQAPPSSR